MPKKEVAHFYTNVQNATIGRCKEHQEGHRDTVPGAQSKSGQRFTNYRPFLNCFKRFFEREA